MKHTIIIYLLAAVTLAASGFSTEASTRKERQLVTQGNKKYTERKFVEAASIYQEALKENPSSTSARYNLGLSQLRQVSNPADTTPANKKLIDAARQNFTEVAGRAAQKPGIAAKANYNLGNLAFNTQDYAGAVNYYKQALRIDPNDDHARRNLRIAQKKLQQQNQNKNKDQNKDQQQDKQDQKRDLQQNQDKQEQQPPRDEKINQQTAERILQAGDNKENQTRARVNQANKGDKSVAGGRSSKRW